MEATGLDFLPYILPLALGVIAASVAFGAGAPLVVLCLISRKRMFGATVIAISLSVVGACTGLITGMSEEGTITDVAPAFLSFLSGFVIYLFATVNKSKRIVAPVGIVALSLSLTASYTIATQFRNVWDDHREIRAICVAAYTDSELLSNERAFLEFNRRLGGFCDKTMGWYINKG